MQLHFLEFINRILLAVRKNKGQGKKFIQSQLFSDILFNGNFRTFILIDDMEPLWKLTCHGVLTGPLVLPDLMLKGTVEISYIFSLTFCKFT
jgi:hypothetical protein